MIDLKSVDYLKFENPERNYQTVDYQPTMDYSVSYRDIQIYWGGGCDGGGNVFGLAYPEVIRTLYPGRVFNHCFEWCSGPGFIGYALYVDGLCRELSLGDIYLPSLACAEYTKSQLPAHYNKDPIHTIHFSNCADLKPQTKYDLIVSNPPHWNWQSHPTFASLILNHRINSDPDWTVHKNFFSNIKKNLAEDGIILLQEQSWASGPTVFESMVKEAGLKIRNCYYDSKALNFWYLEVVHD